VHDSLQSEIQRFYHGECWLQQRLWGRRQCLTKKKSGTLYLRGLTDIVKNKTLFFIPFFSAYLAFLLAKTDYIKGANFVIWLLIGSILPVSVRYISVVSNLLWAIESCRIIFIFHKMGIEPWVDKERDIAAFGDVMKLIPKMVAGEDWWFKKVIQLMYLGPSAFCRTSSSVTTPTYLLTG
jgi:hypothetical protein